jgi:hypothetical protein
MFAILQIGVGLLLFRPRNRIISEMVVVSRSYEVPREERRKRDLYLLLSFVVGLVVLLIVLEAILQKSMLLLVSIICLCIPFIWVVLRNKGSIIREEVPLYKDRLLTQSKTEICLFISVGLFGNAISHTPVKNVLEQVIYWSATQSIGVLFLLIILFVTFMALLGVHQIIVIPLILLALQSSKLEISLLIIAFMCIFTWMLSSAISPLNAMNIIISQCVKKDGITVAYKWNGLYFLSISVIAFGYVYILSWIQ